MSKLEINGTAIATLSSFKQEQRQSDRDTVIRWSILLKNTGITADTRQQLVDTLAALAGQDVNAKLILGHTTVAEISIDGSRFGPRIVAVSKLDEAEVHSEGCVKLTIEARVQDSTSILQWSTIQTSTKISQGILTIHRRVEAQLKRGEDLDSHVETYTPSALTGYVRREIRTTTSSEDSSIHIETMDEQSFQNLPANIEDGHYTISISQTEQGSFKRIKGFFMGKDAMAQALKLRPVSCIEEDLTEDEFTRRIDFTFTCRSEFEHEMSDSLTFTTIRRVIDLPVLGRYPSVRQEIGQPYMEITQEGMASEISDYPSPAAPKFPTDLIERKVHYAPARSGQSRVTSWFYRFRSRGVLAESRPEVS